LLHKRKRKHNEKKRKGKKPSAGGSGHKPPALERLVSAVLDINRQHWKLVAAVYVKNRQH